MVACMMCCIIRYKITFVILSELNIHFVAFKGQTAITIKLETSPFCFMSNIHFKMLKRNLT